MTTATVPGIGVILVDAQGHALYTHTDANGKAVACTGACATAWPPLTVAAGTKVKAPKGVKALATTGATHQVTSGGLPLYRFSGDAAAKQAKGDGVNGFGGTWHVVTVKAQKAKSTPDHQRRHRRRVLLTTRGDAGSTVVSTGVVEPTRAPAVGVARRGDAGRAACGSRSRRGSTCPPARSRSRPARCSGSVGRTTGVAPTSPVRS